MILVTGGTGLVGSHLLYNLVKNGDQVRAIYRTEKKLDKVRQVFSYYANNPDELYARIDWIPADLNDLPGLSRAFDGVTHVYHCAAFVSLEPDKYRLLRKINIEGTANVVNLCIDMGIKKLCYVSSIAAIGHAQHDDEMLTEQTEWNKEADNSVYAITKYGAEMEVWRATQEGLETVIVNPGVILGPGYWRYGSGSLFRLVHRGLNYYTRGISGYVDIWDVTRAMTALMASSISGQRYILVSENLSFKDFASILANSLQVDAPKKEVSKFKLQLAWRLDWLTHKLRNKRRKLSRQMAASLVNNNVFSNEKVKRDLDFSFTPIRESASRTSQFFLDDLKSDRIRT